MAEVDGTLGELGTFGDGNLEGQVAAESGIKSGGKLGSERCSLSDSQNRDDKSLDQNDHPAVYLKSKSAGQGEPLKMGGS